MNAGSQPLRDRKTDMFKWTNCMYMFILCHKSYYVMFGNTQQYIFPFSLLSQCISIKIPHVIPTLFKSVYQMGAYIKKKGKKMNLVTPVFIWSHVWKYPKKSLKSERGTWPWALGGCDISLWLTQRGPLKSWLFWVKHTGCLLYIMGPPLMTVGNVSSQMGFFVELD